MGKGKRNREARKASQRITMGRGELKAYLFNVIDNLDDASYEGFCDLFLTACGVTDGEGNLTEQYANSPYWTVDSGKLKPVDNTELMQQLSDSVRETIEQMEEES